MAPYQHRNAENVQTPTSHATGRATSSSDFVDYRNFKFVDLEDVSAVKFEKVREY
jgi:hypothetical protein